MSSLSGVSLDPRHKSMLVGRCSSELSAANYNDRRDRSRGNCSFPLTPILSFSNVFSATLHQPAATRARNDTAKIAIVTRPGGPTAKRQPSPEGLGNRSEDDPSAGGAALDRSSAAAPKRTKTAKKHQILSNFTKNAGMDILVLGSATGEGYLAPPGDIRASDVVSGKLLWVFPTIPPPR